MLNTRARLARPRKRHALAALAASATLTLTGCSFLPFGPQQLSTEEAGERYLNIICPSNLAMTEFENAFTEADYNEWVAGGAPDPSGVLAAAANARDVTQRAAVLLADENVVWPDSVADDISVVRQSLLASVSDYGSAARSATWGDAWQLEFSEASSEELAAPQSVRATLGLSADTDSSCVGYEDGHAALAE